VAQRPLYILSSTHRARGSDGSGLVLLGVEGNCRRLEDARGRELVEDGYLPSPSLGRGRRGALLFVVRYRMSVNKN